MLRNYFTLCQAAMELHELLAGGKLMEIHSQEKNEITLGFTLRDALRMQIIVVARSPKFTFFTREGGQRKQRNSASLMEIVHGMMVGGVYVSPSDREIIITLEGSCALVMRLYSSNTNVLLVEDGRITEAFKESLTLAGQHYPPPEKGVAIVRHLETLANSEALFREKLEATDPDEALEKRLSRVLCGFDMFLVRKVLDRSGTKRGTTELHEAFGGLFYDLLSPLPAVFISKQGEPELTILGTNEALHQVTFERVLEALNRYTTLMHRHLKLQEQIRPLRQQLERQIRKTEKELSAVSPETLGAHALEYETWGHLLTANIGNPQPASPGCVTVRNIFAEEAPEMVIPLKAGLNIQQNAAWYFSKAAKSRTAMTVMQERHLRLLHELETMRVRLHSLCSMTSAEELETLETGLHGKARKPAQQGPDGNRKTPQFRTVELARGITLYIGKNAANNDVLTFQHSRPDDIWLHARGASGSHCVIKGATLQNTAEIRRAAEIAAWYSSARPSALVPVIYTLRKYVRKAKNSSPGSVIVEREKVIMVKPLKE